MARTAKKTVAPAEPVVEVIEETKPLQELIVVESTPAKISVNYTVLKDALTKDLEKYRIVVTADTLAGAKKLATELNKTSEHIDKTRKLKAAEASVDIVVFNNQMKELEALCQTGRTDILNQVKKFEDVTRESCRQMLIELLAALNKENNVQHEFRTAFYDDMILISNVTNKGLLTKTVKDTLEQRVRDDRSAQDKVEMRLVKLENASFRAGLSAPLTRDHVAHFLKKDDATYETELQRIIDAEIARQQQAEVALRQKIEREKQQKEEAERLERERQKVIAKATPAPEVKPAPATTVVLPAAVPVTRPAVQHPVVKSEDPSAYVASAPAGKTLFVITATFELLAPSTVADDRVKDKLLEKLTAAGITSLKSISVARN